MENKDAKEILGRYICLKEKNDDRIEGYLRKGTTEQREPAAISKIEGYLRKEREAGFLVQAVLAQIPDRDDRKILELRYLRGCRMREISRYFYARRPDYEEHAEAYRAKVNQQLGLALLKAADVLRELGVELDPDDEEDLEE